MAEHLGVSSGKIFDVRVVGIGKRIKRQALRGARQCRFDARHFAYENRVPALNKLGVGQLDAQRGTQPREELRIADFALFVASIQFVAHKPADEVLHLASGMTRPAVERTGEIDIEYDAAKIEQ